MKHSRLRWLVAAVAWCVASNGCRTVHDPEPAYPDRPRAAAPKPRPAPKGDSAAVKAEKTRVARAHPVQSETAPLLVAAAKKALGPQPQYTGTLKPTFSATGNKLSARVPIVAFDGSGTYVKRLDFAVATGLLASWLVALFDKVSNLGEMDFTGVHRGLSVIRVRLTRAQYNKLGIRKLEEELGRYQGTLIEPLLAGKISRNEAARRVLKRRRQRYVKLFALLPKGQVELAPSLH